VDRFGGWRDVLREMPTDSFRRWDLAELQSIDATRLLGGPEDATGKFFLVLAVAFNDLKGMVIYERFLIDYGVPSDAVATPTLAQWRGIRTQIHRWIAGSIFELMKFIASDRSREALAGAELQRVVGRVAASVRAQWTVLVAAARGEHTRPNGFLFRLRNSAAFHYNEVELERAYRSVFVDNAQTAPNAANQSAMYSVGGDMDATRFYYADAAAQRLFLSFGVETPSDRAIVELAEAVNASLGPLIAAFIAGRVAA